MKVFSSIKDPPSGSDNNAFASYDDIDGTSTTRS